jgi:hypothetical protein
VVGAFVVGGVGVGYLPLVGRWLALGALGILALLPAQDNPLFVTTADTPPIRQTVAWLSRHMQPEDVLIVDPGLKVGLLEWAHYEALYAPAGLRRASAVEPSMSRVWHLERQGSEDQALKREIQRGRYARTFIGPWYFIVTLYEGPPAPPTHVGTALLYHGARLSPPAPYRVGEPLAVQLWWSAEAPLNADYSTSLRLVRLQDETQWVQLDGPPQGELTPSATSAFVPGEVYRDDRTLTLPFDLEGGDYELRLYVYQWWDGVRLPFAQGASGAGSRPEADYSVVGRFRVVSFNRG